MHDNLMILSTRYQTRLYLLEKISIQDARWHKFLPKLFPYLERIHETLFINENICLSFNNDQAVKRLNYEFRGKNKATNVLTFELTHCPTQFGGDIVFALQTIKKEAKLAKRPVIHHLSHLIIHGLLHLQGFDHICVNDARIMERKEASILHKIGIPNPWKTLL
ncbi:Endoribonuclease YbeY [Commensalibacter sp. Nvir]|uniref:rRNA maturation RNase YbeY n=1 Tax=Commensalibacter sp. Nvir TaxID=3069817 RepID=UPI002D574CCD|nr:Endoribonuclease YbeY [Commensalibacter sp. Nvir]